MVKIKYYLFFVLIILSAQLKAQEVNIKAFTDATKYSVGDYIKYTIQINHNKNIKVNKPNVKDSLQNIEVLGLNHTSKELENSQIEEKFVYTLAKYDSGSALIPAIRIELLDKNNKVSTIYTNKLVIDVTTLEVDQQKEIMDVKAPLKIELNWLFILAIVLIAVLLLSAGYYGYKYYQKKKLIKQGLVEVIVIPPYEAALNLLKELEEKKLWQKGQVKDYHTQLTFIIRKYFEDQFKFNALEMTSAEIINFLNSNNFKLAVTQTVERFFSNADMVKFAKFLPLPTINEAMLKEAYTIVNDSKQINTIEPEPIIENIEVKDV
ncbi:MAG: hypothetical protein V1773_18150 [bacterium]